MKYYIVDAFADELFKGNPAGVCLPEKELSDETMQKISSENNLAETAFLIQKENKYYLRWFTPEVEIDLCGHATLATAFVMLNYITPQLSQIEFETKSGKLTVTKEDNLYKMDFPRRMPTIIKTDYRLSEALNCKILETYMSKDLLVIVENEDTVKHLDADMDKLSQINNNIDFTILLQQKETHAILFLAFLSLIQALLKIM